MLRHVSSKTLPKHVSLDYFSLTTYVLCLMSVYKLDLGLKMSYALRLRIPTSRKR